MKSPFTVGLCFVVILFGGCASSNSGGTVGYYLKIESSEPGERVDVDDDFVGKTSIKVRVWGDRDGTFRVKGYPTPERFASPGRRPEFHAVLWITPAPWRFRPFSRFSLASYFASIGRSCRRGVDGEWARRIANSMA